MRHQAFRYRGHLIKSEIVEYFVVIGNNSMPFTEQIVCLLPYSDKIYLFVSIFSLQKGNTLFNDIRVKRPT